MHIIHGIGCIWSGGTANQVTTYLDQVAALLEPRPDGLDGYVLVGVIEQQPLKGGGFITAAVPCEVFIAIQTGVSEVVRQRFVDRIAASLQFSYPYFFGGGPVTAAQMEARLIQEMIARQVQMGWITDRTTDFTGLATDPAALIAKFTPLV